MWSFWSPCPTHLYNFLTVLNIHLLMLTHTHTQTLQIQGFVTVPFHLSYIGFSASQIFSYLILPCNILTFFLFICTEVAAIQQIWSCLIFYSPMLPCCLGPYQSLLVRASLLEPPCQSLLVRASLLEPPCQSLHVGAFLLEPP